MSDYTQCAGCANNSKGEAYCDRCEGSMELKQDEDDRRGYKLPVTVSELANGSHFVSDKDGTYVARTYLRGVPGRELAGAIADLINETYEEEGV